jgi:hypothetical protein
MTWRQYACRFQSSIILGAEGAFDPVHWIREPIRPGRVSGSSWVWQVLVGLTMHLIFEKGVE